jgi:uncharacterized damage-inducible protein DinB
MTTATKDLKEILTGQWTDLGKKVLELGEAIPASAWDESPVAGLRSPGDVFRHLVFWNRWVAASARGESPEGAANEVAKKEAPSRARALRLFEESVAEAAAALAKGAGEMAPERAELAASFLGHSSEHYGQLVIYARLLGIVPPASR